MPSLETDLPPTNGEAAGGDDLLAALANAASAREVTTPLLNMSAAAPQGQPSDTKKRRRPRATSKPSRRRAKWTFIASGICTVAVLAVTVPATLREAIGIRLGGAYVVSQLERNQLPLPADAAHPMTLRTVWSFQLSNFTTGQRTYDYKLLHEGQAGRVAVATYRVVIDEEGQARNVRSLDARSGEPLPAPTLSLKMND